jgi:peptidyl-dipeptidase Dcp
MARVPNDADPSQSANPFLTTSPLTDEYPPFDQIRFEHYRPAFEAGMAEQLAEVAAIAVDPEPPTFANTLEALEASGASLRRVTLVFENIVSSDSTDHLRALEAEIAPLLTAHEDAIHQNARLFARIQAVYDVRHDCGLDTEQVNLVERLHTDFVRAGAALSEEEKETLRALNARLAELASTFGTRLLEDTNDLAVHVATAHELDGLAEDAVEAAAQAAREHGLQGYLLTLALPTGQPAQAMLTNRDLRRRLHEAATTRGSRGNAWDTRATLCEMAAIRAERAALHGYPDHASYVVADETARATDAVTDRLLPMVAPALRNVARVRDELEAALHADGHEGPLRPWDWAFYAERRRSARHHLDPVAVRAYFALDRVLRDGIFGAAHELYGLSFRIRHDLPLPHPDATVYDVSDEDGGHLGLLVCDWFARDSKRGGAWMHEFVSQSRLLDTRPVVTLTLNVPKPPPGQPALLTLDEVDTAFHEFGHALHGLLSDCRYARTSGTDVPRDFVEFPSQVNEMWAWWPSLLSAYAVHHETGEPMPAELAEHLLAAQDEGDPYGTVEILGATLLDWAWHLLPPGTTIAPDDVERFEREALERYGLLHDVVVPRYRSSYFNHAFGDAEGYSSRYYSYLWAEVLDADTVEWFRDNGGPTRTNGDRFRQTLLSRGGTVDVLAATAAFLGHEPRIEPLLKRHGLL